MDTSDGLADAVMQISAASNVKIELQEDLIPINDATRVASNEYKLNLLELVLYGGEDYELLGTMPEPMWSQVQEIENNPFKRIGIVTKGEGAQLLKADGSIEELLQNKIFQHWV